MVKLRELFGPPTLVRISAIFTLSATIPIVLGTVWVSYQLRISQGADGQVMEDKSNSTSPRSDSAPTIKLLLHALFASAMAFFLFSFQVHEKTILLPLMPLTLMIAGKQPGMAGQEFEWAVLLNNIGSFR